MYTLMSEFGAVEWMLLRAILGDFGIPKIRPSLELPAYKRQKILSFYRKNPVKAIQRMNEECKKVKDKIPEGLEQFVSAALDLEIFLDHQAWPSTGNRIFHGIPTYLPDGYTDLGSLTTTPEYRMRERFRLEKQALRRYMRHAKRVTHEHLTPEDAVRDIASYVRHVIPYNRAVNRKYDEMYESVVLNVFIDLGGVCRHQQMLLHCLLQTAGIMSRTVKGNFAGRRHAWCEVELPGGTLIYDAAVKIDGLQRGVNEAGLYEATAETIGMNRYKIKHAGERDNQFIPQRNTPSD